VKEIDSARARAVLRGEIPFDETTMQGDDHDGMSTDTDAVGTQGLEEAAIAEAEAKEARLAERVAQR
jgi:aerobic C4-dicarboxylate transport protein